MTLHIATITPKHIVCVSDRLLSPKHELANDRYKHLVLMADDGSAIISFAGFAGTINSEDDLENSTIDWLTQICSETSSNGKHSIDEHLNDIEKNANGFISKFQKNLDLRLAIFVVGQCKGKQFIRVIDNYLNEHLQETKNIKQEFTSYSANYSKYILRKGFATFYLGSGKGPALKQKALVKKLGFYARNNEPRKIFDTSVQIINEVAPISGGTVGTNCSGVRMSLNDPGIEAYNHRKDVTWDDVMPNTVTSKSEGASITLSNLTINTNVKFKPPAVLNHLRPPDKATSLEDQLKFWYRAIETIWLFHNQQSSKLGKKPNKQELNKFYLWRDEKYDPVEKSIIKNMHETENALEAKEPKRFNASSFPLLREEQRTSDVWDEYIDFRDIEIFVV